MFRANFLSKNFGVISPQPPMDLGFSVYNQPLALSLSENGKNLSLAV